MFRQNISLRVRARQIATSRWQSRRLCATSGVISEENAATEIPAVIVSPKQHINIPHLLPVAKDRPPKGTWDPKEEFGQSIPFMSARHPFWYKFFRVNTYGWKKQYETFFSLLGPGTLVILVGTNEAALQLNPETMVSTLEQATFCLSYAWENLFASCIWMTKSPALVATSLGHDPTDLLRTFGDSQADAQAALHVQGCVVTRSCIAGFTLISKVSLSILFWACNLIVNSNSPDPRP